MKILFIADIHSGKDANYLECGGKDYVNTFGSQFEQYLDKIHLLEKEHNLTINLGDLIYNTDHEDDLLLFKKEEKLLEGDVPLAHVLGNHDFRYLFKNQLSKTINKENTYYSFDLGNYHHIVLDSFQGSKILPGNISHGQILWLKEDLEKTNLSTLVYTHYPIDNQLLDNNYYFKNEPEKAFCQNKEEIRGILESSKKVLAVFCGHLHFYNQEKINGILYTTVPSFTENDGYGKPKAECLSLDLENNKINILIKKLN